MSFEVPKAICLGSSFYQRPNIFFLILLYSCQSHRQHHQESQANPQGYLRLTSYKVMLKSKAQIYATVYPLDRGSPIINPLPLVTASCNRHKYSPIGIKRYPHCSAFCPFRALSIPFTLYAVGRCRALVFERLSVFLKSAKRHLVSFIACRTMTENRYSIIIHNIIDRVGGESLCLLPVFPMIPYVYYRLDPIRII